MTGRWLAGVEVLLIAGSGLSLLALGARFSGFLELFSHFRFQYLLLQAVALAWFLARRRLAMAALVAATAIPHVAAVAAYLPGLVRPPVAAAAGGLRLVAWNLQYNNDDFPRALAYLRATGADVLVLSEFTPRAQQRLAALTADYPFQAYRPQWDAWGIAVYSRLPVESFADVDLDGGLSAQLRVRLRTADGPLDLYAVHLASPTQPGRMALQDRQLAALAASLRGAGDAAPGVPRVVVGDLNLTPYSPRFGRLLADAGLADARRPFGPHVTWPTWPVPLWIPIDHCLVAGPVRATAVTAGPATGSDHRPLEVLLHGVTP
jgi:endonuclease/exonuclease/phosphatase (EEP) superfamily protein YafD